MINCLSVVGLASQVISNYLTTLMTHPFSEISAIAWMKTEQCRIQDTLFCYSKTLRSKDTFSQRYIPFLNVSEIVQLFQVVDAVVFAA